VSEAHARQAARRAVAALGDRSVGVAESLTAGLVCATLGSIPGVSAVLRGGVVAYHPDVKIALLGVDPALLRAGGAVQEAVAEAMATGACRVLRARFGVATTGVAGPGQADGHPAGTVWVSAHDSVSGASASRLLQTAGERDQVRWAATAAALVLLAELAEQNPSTPR